MSAPVSFRDLGLLHAVGDARVECSPACEPDFYVDGLACCDHFAARTLIRQGLIQLVHSGQHGERVPVEFTSQGRSILASPRAGGGEAAR